MGAQEGAPAGFGDSAFSGSGSGCVTGVEAICGVGAGGAGSGDELAGGTVFVAGLSSGADGGGTVFVAWVGPGEDAGGMVFVGVAAGGATVAGGSVPGVTVAGGTVARDTVAGGTVAGGTVGAAAAEAGGTVLAAVGLAPPAASRVFGAGVGTGDGLHSDGVGPAGRSGSWPSVSPNAEGGHAGIVCSVGGSGGQMSLCVGIAESGWTFGGHVSGADLVGRTG